MSTPRMRRRRPEYQLNNNTIEENVDVKVVHVPTDHILHGQYYMVAKTTVSHHQYRTRVKQFTVNGAE